MGLAPNPGGKQTRYPFNCLGKKMCTGMSPSKGHFDCHCDNSQVCCFRWDRSFLHSFSRIFLDWTVALYLKEEQKRNISEWMQVHWSRADLRANSLRDRNGRLCLEITRPSGNDSFEARNWWFSASPTASCNLFMGQIMPFFVTGCQAGTLNWSIASTYMC